ncbi:MAG: hypothetical protein JWO83_2619 [Caulobacteraceae bacterium]|nr:hypothetical protein [Caulobacteraceae bacterium]
MTPEAEAYLAKAREDLEDAREILRIHLAKVAARSAYYAAFHAAEALIIERTGRVAKTHSGVRAAFARLWLNASQADRSAPTFLAHAYRLKEIGDYGVGQGALVTDDEAHEAVEGAAKFIASVSALLTRGPP